MEFDFTDPEAASIIYKELLLARQRIEIQKAEAEGQVAQIRALERTIKQLIGGGSSALRPLAKSEPSSTRVSFSENRSVTEQYDSISSNISPVTRDNKKNADKLSGLGQLKADTSPSSSTENGKLESNYLKAKSRLPSLTSMQDRSIPNGLHARKANTSNGSMSAPFTIDEDDDNFKNDPIFLFEEDTKNKDSPIVTHIPFRVPFSAKAEHGESLKRKVENTESTRALMRKKPRVLVEVVVKTPSSKPTQNTVPRRIFENSVSAAKLGHEDIREVAGEESTSHMVRKTPHYSPTNNKKPGGYVDENHVTAPKPKTNTIRIVLPDHNYKIKLEIGKNLLHDDDFRRRLKDLDIGPDPFPVTLAKDIRSVTVTRFFISHIYGGSPQTFCPVFGKEFTHGYRMIFPSLKMNPNAPGSPGHHGILCRTQDFAGWKDGIQKVLIRLGANAYQYMGEYAMWRTSSLSKQEYQAFSPASKRAWADQVSTRKKDQDVRARIHLRRQLSREPTMKEVKKVSLADCSLVTKEQIIQAFEAGLETIHMWCMECVGYDEDFQREIALKYPIFTAAQRKTQHKTREDSDSSVEISD